MIKYKIYYNLAKIEKIEVKEDFKNYVWLESGTELSKFAKRFSIHDTLCGAQSFLICKYDKEIENHQDIIKHLQKLKIKSIELTEEDIK